MTTTPRQAAHPGLVRIHPQKSTSSSQEARKLRVVCSPVAAWTSDPRERSVATAIATSPVSFMCSELTPMTSRRKAPHTVPMASGKRIASRHSFTWSEVSVQRTVDLETFAATLAHHALKTESGIKMMKLALRPVSPPSDPSKRTTTSVTNPAAIKAASE